MPTPCPWGFTCDEEGLSFVYTPCWPGSVCLGFVKSSTKIDQRSCKMLENIEYAWWECPGSEIYFKYQDHDGLKIQGYGLDYS